MKTKRSSTLAKGLFLLSLLHQTSCNIFEPLQTPDTANMTTFEPTISPSKTTNMTTFEPTSSVSPRMSQPSQSPDAANMTTFEPTITMSPTAGNMTESPTSIPTDGFLGQWVLVQAFAAKDGTDVYLNPVYFPTDIDIILTFSEGIDDATYSLSVKVANIFGTSITVLGEAPSGFDLIEVGLVTATRMMPPDDLIEIESFFSTNLQNLSIMKVNDEGGLEMFGTESMIICEPFIDV